MAKLNITVKYDDIGINTQQQKAVLSISNLIIANNVATSSRDLISTDTPNDLILGSDGKLFVSPDSPIDNPIQTDFLAYYLLAKG